MQRTTRRQHFALLSGCFLSSVFLVSDGSVKNTDYYSLCCMAMVQHRKGILHPSGVVVFTPRSQKNCFQQAYYVSVPVRSAYAVSQIRCSGGS